MILVTGTKRSGTSMWMQILRAAGLPVLGEAFPRDWGHTLREANPDGFWESTLREGIYYATNPHPRTGAYLFPEQVRRHAVKVFIPGLVRSDRAYLDRVIATVRPWRDYVASADRLHELEVEATQAAGHPAPHRMPPALEWWSENFMLVRDIATRRYPVHVVSYEAVVTDPERAVRDALRFVGEGDVVAAAAAVRPSAATCRGAATPPDIEPRDAEVFDALYLSVHTGGAIDAELVARLNETNARLAPKVLDASAAVRECIDEQRRAGDQGASTTSPSSGSTPETTTPKRTIISS